MLVRHRRPLLPVVLPEHGVRKLTSTTVSPKGPRKMVPQQIFSLVQRFESRNSETARLALEGVLCRMGAAAGVRLFLLLYTCFFLRTFSGVIESICRVLSG